MGKGWIAVIIVVVLIIAIVGSCGDDSSSTSGSKSASCGHASCKENGPFYCMGKNDTCNNRTYCAYDLYCDACD